MSDVNVELQRHPFLAGMPPEHYATLAALARYAEFPANTVLFPEGDGRGEFFLLISGRVALEIVSQGQALRIETLSPGTALGWSAVLLGRGKHFQARALEPVTALVFPGPEVLAACRRDPKFGVDMLQRLLGLASSRLQAERIKVLDSFSPVAKKAGA
jgi:CRP/FNR family transcriptional regulator, cyclic AMP receptor protein